jgi:hypothetical protein
MLFGLKRWTFYRPCPEASVQGLGIETREVQIELTLRIRAQLPKLSAPQIDREYLRNIRALEIREYIQAMSIHSL